jgi:hypothetical protein
VPARGQPSTKNQKQNSAFWGGLIGQRGALAHGGHQGVGYPRIVR